MSRRDTSPRERIVYAAVQQLRRSGVTGTGLRQVVEDAAAPWGSLQHYFPGGKDQLVGEALSWAGEFAAGRVGEHVRSMHHPSPSRLFAAIVRDWIAELEARDYERGCPVAAAVVDCGVTNESTRSAAERALETWRAPISAALLAMGVPRRKAASQATLMLCALEGAILLSRAERSTEPLRTVTRELAPVLDSGLPAARGRASSRRA